MIKLFLILAVLALAGCAQANPPNIGTPGSGNPSATPISQDPAWLKKLISDYESKPVGSVPDAITRYTYKGQAVYYVHAPCCDQYNLLYDEQGAVLCAPDGGFTGQGDGRCPNFKDAHSGGQLVWHDSRTR